MKSKRKFFVAFCFIVLDAFLVVGFLVIRDATAINNLKKEINELTKLDVTKDRYNRSIKTSGGYAIVESSIKDYLDGYAIGVQEVSGLIHDKKLGKILSYDNYLEDGPDFKNSIAYLEESKVRFNSEIDELLEDLEQDKIMNNIHKHTKDSYYVALYEELMFNDDMKDELYESKDLFEKTKIKVNGIYDNSLAVLNFLVTYNGSWKLENGEIKFENQELCDYYNSLIAKVQTKKDA
jgi:hypothetical protein